MEYIIEKGQRTCQLKWDKNNKDEDTSMNYVECVGPEFSPGTMNGLLVENNHENEFSSQALFQNNLLFLLCTSFNSKFLSIYVFNPL